MPYTETSSSIASAAINPASLAPYFTSGAQVDWSAVTATDAAGRKTLPAFSAVAIEGGKIVPRDADSPATAILLSDATEGMPTDALTGYGYVRGGGFYEELLPDSSDAAWATIKTELQSAGAFYFETYSDSRAA